MTNPTPIGADRLDIDPAADRTSRSLLVSDPTGQDTPDVNVDVDVETAGTPDAGETRTALRTGSGDADDSTGSNPDPGSSRVPEETTEQ